MHWLTLFLPDSSGFAAAAALWTGLFGSFCFLWALWLQVRLRRFQRRTKLEMATADLAKGFKKALLTGAAQGAVVLKAQGREQQYYGDGKALYESCLASPTADKVIRAVASLVETGASFALSVPGSNCDLILRGVPVAGRAVLYLEGAITV